MITAQDGLTGVTLIGESSLDLGLPVVALNMLYIVSYLGFFPIHTLWILLHVQRSLTQTEAH